MLKHYFLKRSSPISKYLGARFEKSKESILITAIKESRNIDPKNQEIHSLKKLLSFKNMFNTLEMTIK